MPVDLPEDVPWRRLAFGADLTQVVDTTRPTASVTAGAQIEGLAPSLAVFQYVAPQQSDAVPDTRAYPDSRVVLLRAASSLTGMQFVTTTRLFGFTLTRKEYLPCIGAVVTLSLDSPDLKRNPKAPLYIRDSFPKRQEMVLNEVLGTETMERETERHSLTKNWNVSGGFNLKGFNVGGGTSTTEVRESQLERSTTDSHVVNVSHVHHVLTAYHLGSRAATLTIQPRPYEGETWEMLGGPRRVEGIQDFSVVVNVPSSIKRLNVEACLTIGFLGYLSGGRLPPKPLDPRQIADAFESSGNGIVGDLIANALDQAAEKIEAWEAWIERYQRWLQIQEFVSRINTIPRVITAHLCATGTIDLNRPLHEAVTAPITPGFADVALPNVVAVGLPTPAASGSARPISNYFAEKSFDAVMKLSRGKSETGLASLEFVRASQWEMLTALPRDHGLMGRGLREFGALPDADREVLEGAGIETLGDLVDAGSANEGRDIDSIRPIGPRLFEAGPDQRAKE